MIRSQTGLLGPCLLTLVLVQGMFPRPTLADEDYAWLKDGQIHGFATQGFVKTSDNRFFGPSDDGSFEFTELGINGSVRPTSNLLLTGQLLMRRAGDMYDGSPSVDFLLGRVNLYEDEVNQFEFSAGRLKNPIGLYNQTRDVAHTRPSIFLPQVVYFDKVRNLEMSGDGVAIHLRRFVESGEIALDYHRVNMLLDKNVEAAYLGTDWGGTLGDQSWADVAQVRYTNADESWRAAVSYLDVDMKFNRAVADPIGSGQTDVQFLVASLQFNTDDWTFTTEYALEPIKWSGFDLPGPGMPRIDQDLVAETYYFQVEHQLRGDVSLFGRYEVAYADRADKSGVGASTASGGARAPHDFYSKIFTFGGRWDVTRNFMLRAEVAFHDGAMVLSTLENPIGTPTTKDWTQFSILGSYRF